MSIGGQSPGQLATSPTKSMEINHPSPAKENQAEPQQITINATSSAETTTEQPAIEANATASVTATTTTTSVPTPAPPVEPEVEWTTLNIDGREFHVPKALDIDPLFLAAFPGRITTRNVN